MSTTPQAQATRILLVDDDDGLRRLIADFLRTQTFDVYEANGGAAMRAILQAHPVDLAILDVMMPREDGLSLARELSENSSMGIILISALGSETDRIVGLEVGADDYLAKPVSPRELLARIRAVLRRRNAGQEKSVPKTGVYHFSGWTLDTHQRVLRDPSSTIVSLSPGEFALLHAFIRNPQRILTRDQLLDLTRGETSDVIDRSVDSQTSRLRRKLGSRARIEIIRTVRNEGYMFVPKVDRP
jgi:two-component system, OmpR family, response regulator